MICGQAGVAIYKASHTFWACYRKLPRNIQQLADKKFELLKQNPRHPFLRLKKTGSHWAARINRDYRALAIEDGDMLIWVWIGKHDEYTRRLG
ncbi:MAG: hypothetical protein OXH63_14275 [Gemmatimonadetes bacterium]|nr:hypothetical protein [Gemmatimonadota bacterium]